MFGKPCYIVQHLWYLLQVESQAGWQPNAAWLRDLLSKAQLQLDKASAVINSAKGLALGSSVAYEVRGELPGPTLRYAFDQFSMGGDELFSWNYVMLAPKAWALVQGMFRCLSEPLQRLMSAVEAMLRTERCTDVPMLLANALSDSHNGIAPFDPKSIAVAALCEATIFNLMVTDRGCKLLKPWRSAAKSMQALMLPTVELSSDLVGAVDKFFRANKLPSIPEGKYSTDKRFQRYVSNAMRESAVLISLCESSALEGTALVELAAYTRYEGSFNRWLLDRIRVNLHVQLEFAVNADAIAEHAQLRLLRTTPWSPKSVMEHFLTAPVGAKGPYWYRATFNVLCKQLEKSAWWSSDDDASHLLVDALVSCVTTHSLLLPCPAPGKMFIKQRCDKTLATRKKTCYYFWGTGMDAEPDVRDSIGTGRRDATDAMRFVPSQCGCAIQLCNPTVQSNCAIQLCNPCRVGTEWCCALRAPLDQVHRRADAVLWSRLDALASQFWQDAGELRMPRGNEYLRIGLAKHFYVAKGYNRWMQLAYLNPNALGYTQLDSNGTFVQAFRSMGSVAQIVQDQKKEARRNPTLGWVQEMGALIHAATSNGQLQSLLMTDDEVAVVHAEFVASKADFIAAANAAHAAANARQAAEDARQAAATNLLLLIHQTEQQQIHEPEQQQIHEPEQQQIHQPEQQQIHQPGQQQIHEAEQQQIHQPGQQQIHEPEQQQIHEPEQQQIHEPEQQLIKALIRRLSTPNTKELTVPFVSGSITYFNFGL